MYHLPELGNTLTTCQNLFAKKPLLVLDLLQKGVDLYPNDCVTLSAFWRYYFRYISTQA